MPTTVIRAVPAGTEIVPPPGRLSRSTVPDVERRSIVRDASTVSPWRSVTVTSVKTTLRYGARTTPGSSAKLVGSWVASRALSGGWSHVTGASVQFWPSSSLAAPAGAATISATASAVRTEPIGASALISRSEH